jgi:hypothetical protein
MLRGRIIVMKNNFHEEILEAEKDLMLKYFYVVVDMSITSLKHRFK